MRSSQQYQSTVADEGGWPVDDDGWTIYDPLMYEPPSDSAPAPAPPEPLMHEEAEYEAEAEDEDEEPISPESPHTPDSSFDEIEREWNSAVSVYSASNDASLADRDAARQHSRDTSDQSYHSAMSSMAWGMDEDPVDFYLTGRAGSSSGLGIGGVKPLWHGIARSISTQAGRSSF